nr:SapC family protein [Rhodanobacter sp. MP1X3]
MRGDASVATPARRGRGINVAEVLFYERPVPLNRIDHKDMRLKGVPNLKYAMKAHSVPLTGTEFAIAARDLLIVFAGNEAKDAGPVALLGLRQDENLYIDAEGQWAPDIYVPAFVRRYPFVLAEKPDGQPGEELTVFLDEDYVGFNKTEGERLFKEDGTDTELLTKAVGFLGEFQQNIARTRWFLEQLNKHDLLQPRNIRLQRGAPDSADSRSINLNGLFVVNEEKLRTLDEKTTQEFAKEGVFGWIYAHLLSLSNIDRLARRLELRELAETPASDTRN